jgi:hypothetical protein
MAQSEHPNALELPFEGGRPLDDFCLFLQRRYLRRLKILKLE